MNRRSLIAGAMAAVATPLSFKASFAQNYPDRPVRLVVPYAAGTTTDLLARQVTEKVSDLLGQRLVIENKAGAGGSLGAESAARSTADGYTLLWGTSQTQAVNISLYKSIKYDPMKDFAPVARIASQPLVLVVHPDVPARSVAELIALVKKQPEKLNYASTGSGTSAHLAGASFNKAAGLQLLHVPYNGGQVFQDLLSGRTSMIFYPYLPLKGYVEAGQLIPLATLGAQRLAELPNVPTMIESGYPDFVFASWNAVYAPVGTPTAIVDTLTKAFERAMADADLQKRLAGTGTTIEFAGPAETAAFTAKEIARFREVIAVSGASVN
jgi:tripartite-type tricarboxylate transporter receptor subunit TctC